MNFRSDINFSTQVKDKLPKHKLLIFTGPIDAFYASQGWDKLEYRSIFFEVSIKVPVGNVNFIRYLLLIIINI